MSKRAPNSLAQPLTAGQQSINCVERCGQHDKTQQGPLEEFGIAPERC